MSDTERLATVQAFRLTPEGVDLAVVKGTQAWQDMKDGAALRNLREALPEGYEMDVHLRDGYWDVTAGVDVWVGERAATIAEAADKCREALTTPPSTPPEGPG